MVRKVTQGSWNVALMSRCILTENLEAGCCRVGFILKKRSSQLVQPKIVEPKIVETHLILQEE